MCLKLNRDCKIILNVLNVPGQIVSSKTAVTRKKMKMLRYVFIISEIELNRGWYNLQVIITSLINSKLCVNIATKAKLYPLSVRVCAGDFWYQQRMMDF